MQKCIYNQKDIDTVRRYLNIAHMIGEENVLYEQN